MGYNLLTGKTKCPNKQRLFGENRGIEKSKISSSISATGGNPEPGEILECGVVFRTVNRTGV